MRVFVTGGTGNVGRAVVARLVRHGHEVRVIGRRSGMIIEGTDYAQCDITDYDALRKQVEGSEAIVHLAAIPHPAGRSGQEIFRVNCTGTFNVYHAAADEGIKRIACASSINALGYNYGVKSFDLRYFPLDEEHPSFTTHPYSFSKQITEEIAAYFWRREGISSVCLRLPWVYEPTGERLSRVKQHLLRFRQAFDELLALPDVEREERVRQVILKFEAWRVERAMEKPFRERRRTTGVSSDSDSMLLFGRSDFWAIINAEDSAQAFEKGLLADYQGSYPLYINDNHNSVGMDSEALARVFFPGVRARRRPLEGTEALVSIDKARKLIGFEPQHSVSQWFE